MLAIIVSLRTRYACHLSNKRDQVCLPSFLIGTRHACHIFKRAQLSRISFFKKTAQTWFLGGFWGPTHRGTIGF